MIVKKSVKFIKTRFWSEKIARIKLWSGKIIKIEFKVFPKIFGGFHLIIAVSFLVAKG